MKFKDVLKWNYRLSGVYALGVWTMIASYGFLKFSGRLEDTSAKQKQVEEEEEKNPNQVTFNTPHSKHVLIYKKDFVPYTTRMYNLVTSFTGDAKDSGNESSDP